MPIRTARRRLVTSRPGPGFMTAARYYSDVGSWRIEPGRAGGRVRGRRRLRDLALLPAAAAGLSRLPHRPRGWRAAGQPAPDPGRGGSLRDRLHNGLRRSWGDRLRAAALVPAAPGPGRGRVHPGDG